MKLNFAWQNDGSYHQYCMHCHAETISRIYKKERTYYHCKTCLRDAERSIVIDPAIKWWVDDSMEYWHESVGVFVRNRQGKFLFFERTIFPFALTVPSGHVDAGEDIQVAAVRELEEEVGITGSPQLLVTRKVRGDSCRRGADAHVWHAFTLEVDALMPITVREEGLRPAWLSIEEGLQKDLILPVRTVLEEYGERM